MKLKYKITSGFAIAFIALACNKQSEVKEVETITAKALLNEILMSNEQLKLASVELGSISKKQLSNIIKVNGVIDVEPQNLVSISAPLGGYIKSSGLLPGQPVKKGQIIATLENPEFITMQQDYIASKSKLDFLEQEYKRQEILRKADVNSGKTFQQITADYKTEKGKMSGLEAKLKMIGIPISGLDKGLITATGHVYSPINGFVRISNVNTGKYVNPTDVLFELTNKDDMHLALEVFEKDVVNIKSDQLVYFATANDTKYNRKARVFLIGKSTEGNRMVSVHCHLENKKDPELLPGMFVKANIETNGEELPTLPVEAIVQSEGNDFVVVQKNKTASGALFVMVPVEKGIEEGGYTAVTLPENYKISENSIVVKGAYSILSALKNSQEKE